MRVSCLVFLLVSLSSSPSKADLIDSMMASRIHTDPYAYAWNQYAASSEVLREQFNLSDNAKITFSMQITPSAQVQRFSVKVRFCAKNVLNKCIKDNFPILTFNNSKAQLLIQDLILVNLKKETLLEMAALAKAGNLVIVASIHEVSRYWLDKLISEIVFDFNTAAYDQPVIEMTPKNQSSFVPFVQFQFQYSH